MSGHLGSCSNQDSCGGLVQGLNGENLEGLGLNGGDNRPGSNDKGDISDIKKAAGRVFRLCFSYPFLQCCSLPIQSCFSFLLNLFELCLSSRRLAPTSLSALAKTFVLTKCYQSALTWP